MRRSGRVARRARQASALRSFRGPSVANASKAPRVVAAGVSAAQAVRASRMGFARRNAAWTAPHAPIRRAGVQQIRVQVGTVDAQRAQVHVLSWRTQRRHIERSRLADEGHGASSKAGGSNKYHRCVGEREVTVKLDIDDTKRRDARCREVVCSREHLNWP